MLLWEALALGALQGATEFLPVSSSAHLTLLPLLLNWTSPLLNSLTFDVALHFGTLFAVCAYFWKDLVALASAWARGIANRTPWAEPESRLAWWIGLGTLPAIALGVPFQDAIETAFRAPAAVAAWLIAAGLALGAAERFSRKTRPLAELTWFQALVIGLAQACALLPGVSRSGATLTAGLALGLRREDAARFSFLLALPAVAGACALKGKALLHLVGSGEVAAVAAGVAASALVGWLCIWGLLAFVRRRSLYVFVIYRLVLGAWVLAWVWRT